MKPSQRNGAGNTRREEPLKPASPGQEIRPGDIVAVTQAALKMPRLSTMSPRLLIDIGWGNEFVVREVFQHEEDGFCLVIEPCCDYLVADRRTGKVRCNGHQAVFFTKVGSLNPPAEEAGKDEKPRNKGDRSAAVSLPWLGEIASMKFEDDPEIPKFTFTVAGKPTTVFGPIAKMFGQAAKDNHII